MLHVHRRPGLHARLRPVAGSRSLGKAGLPSSTVKPEDRDQQRPTIRDRTAAQELASLFVTTRLVQPVPSHAPFPTAPLL